MKKSYVSVLLITAASFFTLSGSVIEQELFFDDFTGNSLDLGKWWYGKKVWGSGNNGVIPENVSVENGVLRIYANGDNYSGPLKGIRKAGGQYIQDRPGTRTGGVIVTDSYFGSGRYEVRMRIPPALGVCSAIWTFHYQEIYQCDPRYDQLVGQGYTPQGNSEIGYWVVVNHEIDIETPTALKGQPSSMASYRNARFNTWIGERSGEYTDVFMDLGHDYNDGQFHTWRFDWHTGGNGETPRVEFYINDDLKAINTTHIPFIKGRLWIGTWFPLWAGETADFDREYLEIDWVRITPFNQPGDVSVPESYPDDGLTKFGGTDGRLRLNDFSVIGSLIYLSWEGGDGYADIEYSLDLSEWSLFQTGKESPFIFEKTASDRMFFRLRESAAR